jgi:hypothetical protein
MAILLVALPFFATVTALGIAEIVKVAAGVTVRLRVVV